MLVLTRKVDEKIFIGNNREVIAKILRIQGGKVRIGIKAPKNWQVIRDEAQRKKRKRRFLKNLRRLKKENLY